MSNYNINSLLVKAVESGASDLHLMVMEAPALRLNGKIVKLDEEPISFENINQMLNEIVPFSIKDKIINSYDFDFPYQIEGVSRFRVNVGMSFGSYKITIRIIPFEIPTFEQLNLPPKIEHFTHLDNGIVFITGVAGSGKSTTIASILNYINNHSEKHIITIEDPIEYVYKSNKCIFTQRQIGLDTTNYVDGIKYALRQDPDIILIGEIRDAETMQNALNAAETGHLVFTTLHTFNATQTINRVLGFYEPHQREQVRNQLAETYRGSISQKLISKDKGTGRIAAFEILSATSTIKDFIIKDELEEIYKLIKRGTYNDMITFNQSLYEIYKKGLITDKTALENTDSPNELMHYIKGIYSGSEGF